MTWRRYGWASTDSAGSAGTSSARISSAAATSRSSRSTTSATRRRWRTCSSTTRSLGPLEEEVEVGDGTITRRRRRVQVLSERDPAALPWGDLGVDVVLESTGFFTEARRARRSTSTRARRRSSSRRRRPTPTHDRPRRQRRRVRPGRAPHRLERLVHDELRRAAREGAARRLRDRAGLHDDDPRVHERPAHPRPAAQGSAARTGGGDQPDPDVDRRRAGDRARHAGAEGQGRRHLGPRARSPTGSVTDLVVQLGARR